MIEEQDDPVVADVPPGYWARIKELLVRAPEIVDVEVDDDIGPHTHVYVGVDDHDECDICGRRPDQFAGLPEHMQPDWDGAS